MISGAREDVGHPVRVERARKFKTWSEMEWSALRLPNLLGEEDDGMIDMGQTDVSSLHEEPSSAHSHARHSSLMDLDRKLLFQDQVNHGHGESSTKSPLPRQDRFTDLQHGSNSLTAFMSSTQPMSDLPDLVVKDIPMSQRPKNRRSVTFAGDLSTMPRSEVPALSTEDSMDTNPSGHFDFYQDVSPLADSCDTSSKGSQFSEFMTGPVSISSSEQPSSASSICSSSSTASSAATSPSDQVPQFPQQNQASVKLQRKRQVRRGAHSRALSEPRLSVVDIEHSASVVEGSTIWAAPKGPSEDTKRQDSLNMSQNRTEHPAVHSQTSFGQRDQTGTAKSNNSSTKAAPQQEEARGTAHLAPDFSNSLPGGYPAMYANPPPMLVDPLQYVYPGTFPVPPLVNQPVILGSMPLPPPPPLTLPYTSPEAAQQMQEAHNVMMMQWMQMHQQMLMMSADQQHQLPFPSPYMRPPQHGGGYGSKYCSHRRRPTGAYGNKSRKLVSIILQECKASQRAPSIEDVAGHVVEFATDSHGSRVVQELMENGTDDVKRVLVTEALMDGVNLMCDTFGNYVAQNFLVHATQSQREAILDLMRGAVVHLSKNSHGCRVVQKAFELAPEDIWFDLVSELCASTQVILECARDGHATHCLQKAVSMLMHFGRKQCPGSDRLLENIRMAVSSDAVALGSHPNASRLVLLVMSDCGTRTQSQALEDILAALQRAFSTLMLDQHGNFCLQHILENGRPEQIRAVRQVVQKNILKLSCHKFGSHLVEKCLSQAPDTVVSDIVSTILESSDKFSQAAKDGDSDGSMLLVFMKDPYANFVVQRAYDVCKGNLRKKLAHEVTARAKLVSKYTYGRHILHHVSKN